MKKVKKVLMVVGVIIWAIATIWALNSKWEQHRAEEHKKFMEQERKIQQVLDTLDERLRKIRARKYREGR